MQFKNRVEAGQKLAVFLKNIINNEVVVYALPRGGVILGAEIATGLTMKAAIKELKLHYEPKKIIVAIPVIPKEFAVELELNEGIEVAGLIVDENFLGSIGSYY